jgi:UDPglucose 6-dehydrogenase
MVMEILVIGIGRIGLVAACCLANSGHSVTGVEINRARLDSLRQGNNPIYESGVDVLLKQGLASGRLNFVPTVPTPLKADLVMITVNTPSSPSGKADLSNVHAAVTQVREAVRSPLTVVMKSTVPPGTGVALKQRYLKDTKVTYVANPEFLRGGQAVNDWYHPSRIVIGTDNKQAIVKMRRLYGDIKAPVLVTDVTSAEMVKYAANAFLTTKISFINEVASLCDNVGASIDDVVKGLGFDPRIGSAHLQPGIGYGGPCLPKDARIIYSLAAEKGYDFKLMRATMEVNSGQRVVPVDRLKHFLSSLRGKHISLLGLAFKPGTDEIAESPSLDIAHLLAAEGAELRVYDPMAMETARTLLPPRVIQAPDIYSAVSGACAIILATEWPEFSKVDWKRIKEAMTPPYVVIDGRNALPQDKLTAIGFKYVGVGRGRKRARSVPSKGEIV